MQLFLKEGVARYLEFVALDDILFGSPASRPPQEQLTARNWVWVTFLLEVFFEAMLDDSTYAEMTYINMEGTSRGTRLSLSVSLPSGAYTQGVDAPRGPEGPGWC